MKKLIDCFFLFSYNSMERQKILNPLTGRMVYADGVVAKSIPKMKKKVSVLEGAVKRTGTTKIAEKKEAVGKLSGAIKRRLAKKPEPKKVYGWEDLPDDIKDKIGGKVKQNKSRYSMNKQIKDFLYYTGLKNPFTKLTDDELYDVLYKSDDLKKYVETAYVKKSIKEMLDMGGRFLKNKIKYEYLERFIKDDRGGGENKRFVEHYRNYSNNNWLCVYLSGGGIWDDNVRYVFLDMDKNMFWRTNLNTWNNDITDRLEKEGIFAGKRLGRDWNDLVRDAGNEMLKQDLVNGRLVYDWDKHRVKDGK